MNRDLDKHTDFETLDEAHNEIKRLLESCRSLYGENKRLLGGNAGLREEIERFREALIQIRDSKHCSYGVNELSIYGTGVTDGHRYCASIARDAIEGIEKEVGDE